MGMSIDESIEVIKHEKPEKPTSMYGTMKKNAFNIAIETMRKYQKIEKIINAPIGGTSAKYNAIVNLIKYSEVDNDDRTS